MVLKSEVGEQEVTIEITQEKERPIEVKFNGESIGALIEKKALISDEMGFLLCLSFRITEIK